jgi:chromosome segregation ATPase
MAESVNAASAPDVKKAAGTVELARQQLENTPLQDTPLQRDLSAACARENAEKAEKQLEKLREAIQNREPQTQDYARLKELEQQQRELARQAEQALAKNPQDTAKANAPDHPWLQKQERVAVGLRQKVQQQLQQTAAQLDHSAAEFARQAAEAAGRKASDRQAPVPAQPLATAFQQASRAAHASSQAAAASHAQAAADALAQAVDGTLRAMQGQAPSKPGHSQAQANQPSRQPGTNPTDALRLAQANPGVPPELAKLGISVEDWEKIKASLKSDVGGSSAIAMPEEYRELVRSYFEQISKGDKR